MGTMCQRNKSVAVLSVPMIKVRVGVTISNKD
jgi:hypothetical protein